MGGAVGGKGAKTPQPTDPIAIGQLQTNENLKAYNQSLQAQRPNQSNASGNLNWSMDPTTGQWTQSVNLSDPAQNVWNQQTENQQSIANMFRKVMENTNFNPVDLNTNMPGSADYSGLGAMPGVANYESLGNIPQVGQYNQQATDLTMKLMQPGLDRTNDAARARAAAMGMGAGSGAGNNFMEFQNSQRSNDAALKAALAGINQGNIEFGQGMQRYGQGAENLNNQYMQGMGIRRQGQTEADQQFNQMMQSIGAGNQATLQERAANLGQLSGLMGLTQQQSANPAFAGTGNVGSLAPANWAGIINNYDQQRLAAANANKASGSSLLGGLMGIGGSILGGPMGGSIMGGIGSMFGGGGGSQAGMVNNLPDYYLR